MARRLFFVDEVRGGHAELHGQEAQHLRKVLRAQAGHRYELSDNSRRYLAEIESFGKETVRFQVVEELPAPELAPRLHLYAALIKFDRFELLLEKATELGVEKIFPIQAERSEKGLETGARKRMARWERIVLEASQQSRRVKLPELEQPAEFSGAINDVAGERYLLDEAPEAPVLLSQLPERGQRAAEGVVSLLIGPEGGWVDREKSAAAEAGWTPVSLGPLVLRAETAAIAALAVLSATWPVEA
jgi:16S rRNA (uracil1498-N3)-methyltransferase